MMSEPKILTHDRLYQHPVRERRLGSATPSGEHHGCADGKVGVIEQREHVRDLLVRDESSSDGLLPNLLEVGTDQVCAGGPALPQGQRALHAYVDEAMCPQALVQAPAPGQGQLATACCHEPLLLRAHFPKERAVLSIARRLRAVEQGFIEILYHQPASWTQSRHHLL